MTGPDPAFISAADWAAISDLLATLWQILGSAAGLGGSMLLAHGMIPSLVNSRDLSADLGRKVRPPLYLAGAAFLAMGLFSAYQFSVRLDVITSIYYQGAQ
jgi:hypothetical protein